MTRVLAVLTGIGFVTVLIEVPGLAHPWAAAATATLFALVAVLGFGWIDRQEHRRRRALAAGYVVVQLLLGYLAFGLGEAGTDLQRRAVVAPR